MGATEDPTPIETGRAEGRLGANVRDLPPPQEGRIAGGGQKTTGMTGHVTIAESINEMTAGTIEETTGARAETTAEMIEVPAGMIGEREEVVGMQGTEPVEQLFTPEEKHIAFRCSHFS